MGNDRFQPIRRTSQVCIYLGVCLLLAGAFVGWVAPALGGPAARALALDAPLSGQGLDVSGYLGADLSALAVIMGVVIGFNVAGLQMIDRSASLSLVRALLLSLAPFLLCWGVATCVALVYFLLPPIVLGQLWQMLLWFGAVVLLMIGYLWNLPWQLSSEYAAAWALRTLMGRPVAAWESIEGFGILQAGVARASERGELATVRFMCMAVGGFLARSRDPRAERENAYDRRRYRALKNLLSGSALHVGLPPNANAYYIGHLTAGALLQAAALGHPVGDARLDLFSSLFRAIGDERDRVDPLWTGVRHALCRKGPHGEPYLLTYWHERQAWAADDPRRTQRIAEGLLLMHAHCWRTLRTSPERGPASSVPTGELLPPSGQAHGLADETRAPDALLLIDLYGDLGTHLGPEIAGARSRTARRVDGAPLHLLDAVHQLAQDVWYPRAAPEDREAVSAAYAEQRVALARQAGELAGVNDPARTPVPVAR